MRKRNYYMTPFLFKTGEAMENSNVLHFEKYIKTQGIDNAQICEYETRLSKLEAFVKKQTPPLEGEKTPFIAELWHWVEQKKDAGEILPQTFDKYKCVLNRHIVPFFDTITPSPMLSNVSPSLIKGFIAGMRKKGKDSTLKEAINSLIKPFMTAMCAEGKIVCNPTAGIKLKGLKKAHKRAFTDTEIRQAGKGGKGDNAPLVDCYSPSGISGYS